MTTSSKPRLTNRIFRSLLDWMTRLPGDTPDANMHTPSEDKSLLMSPEAELDFMWQAFTNLNEWVRFSDTKAAAVLAANGIIVASIATWLAGAHLAIVSSWEAIAWLGLIVMASFFSSAYSLFSLLPNLLGSVLRRRTSEVGSSLIFFADIAGSFPSSELFHHTVRQALSDPDRAVAQLTQQVWANSKVAANKYRCVTWAIRGLAAAIFLGFVGIMILATIKLERNI